MPALLAACGGGSADRPAGVQTIGCAADQVQDTPMGRLVNNTWNRQAAGGFAWSQCLLQRQDGSSVQYGWSWSWPTPGTTVYAYPELVIGAKPWDPGPGNDARFPRRIADTRRLLVSYDAEVVATGTHNLAASIWLIRTPAVASPPDPSAIAAELMVWTEAVPADGFVAGGSKRGEVQIDGTTWDVWAAENWGDQSGGSAQRWTYIAYTARTPTRAAQYDARKLIADAVARGLISADLYIANVELGNEVAGGAGQTFIRSFAVTID